MLLSTLLRVLQRAVDPSSPNSKWEGRVGRVVSMASSVVQPHLYSQLCYDIRYALNHPPISLNLYTEPRLLPIFLESLELLQGMHPIKRMLHVHTEQTSLTSVRFEEHARLSGCHGRGGGGRGH